MSQTDKLNNLPYGIRFAKGVNIFNAFFLFMLGLAFVIGGTIPHIQRILSLDTLSVKVTSIPLSILFSILFFLPGYKMVEHIKGASSQIDKIRVAQIKWSLLGLLFIPIGTVLNAIVLYFMLTSSEVRAYYNDGKEQS